MRRPLFSVAFTLTATTLMELCALCSPSFAQSADAPYQGRVQTQVVVKDPIAQNHAQYLLHRLLNANGIAPTSVDSVQIIANNSLNASTDGQRILFTEGLWRALQSDDQRAFVIGHELAHITRHHVPKTQLRRLGLLAFASWAQNRFSAEGDGGCPLLNTATQAGLALTELSFSRQQEYGADEQGLQYLTRAGFRPQAAIETMDILDRASPAQTPQFLRSHPLSRNRIRQLVKRHQALSGAR